MRDLALLCSIGIAAFALMVLLRSFGLPYAEALIITAFPAAVCGNLYLNRHAATSSRIMSDSPMPGTHYGVLVEPSYGVGLAPRATLFLLIVQAPALNTSTASTERLLVFGEVSHWSVPTGERITNPTTIVEVYAS